MQQQNGVKYFIIIIIIVQFGAETFSRQNCQVLKNIVSRPLNLAVATYNSKRLHLRRSFSLISIHI